MNNHPGQKTSHIWKCLLQVGVLGTTLFSGFLILGSLIFPRLVIVAVFGLTISAVLTILGSIGYLGGGGLTKSQFLGVIRGTQLHTFVSIILVAWNLIIIPAVISGVIFFHSIALYIQSSFLFPFYGSGVHSFEVYPISPFPLNLFTFYLMHPNSNGNPLFGISRLMGMGFVIFTCSYLCIHLLQLFVHRPMTYTDHSRNLLTIEASLTLLVLLFLGVNLVIPLWEFFDPRAYLSTMVYHGIEFVLTPLLSMFIITWLITGRFSGSDLVIGNLVRWKFRVGLAFVLSLLSSIPYLMILVLPSFFFG
ncbi:MAG: hypothetical protein ACFFE8_14980 [Candidatus Heimdallarchaeota archaeon]